MLSALTVDADLATRLDRLGPGTLRARAADRLAFAHDASHYRMIPAGVVTVTDTAHLAGLMRLSGELGLPVGFRSGGTSLSGQASTQALLLDTRRHFRAIEVLDRGLRVRDYIHRDHQGLRDRDYIHPDCSRRDSEVRPDRASKADPDAPGRYK